MARYKILARMLALPKAMPIAEADTPAEAVNKAREFEKDGKEGVRIGDVEAAEHYPIATFAAKHGLR
ncbi:MAG: hypothetical protein KF779_12360 [Hyphomonadaceae bacterium]|nr:hypothetical protein [Hyphomonadaceae bacterium]